jgi:hypothetical protein
LVAIARNICDFEKTGAEIEEIENCYTTKLPAPLKKALKRMVGLIMSTTYMEDVIRGILGVSQEGILAFRENVLDFEEDGDDEDDDGDEEEQQRRKRKRMRERRGQE